MAAIRNIGAVIEQVRQISSGIASAVDEQGAATQEIARNVQQAAMGTERVCSNLASLSQSAAATGGTAEKVLLSAGQQTQQSENLRTEVAAFLNSIRT